MTRLLSLAVLLTAPVAMAGEPVSLDEALRRAGQANPTLRASELSAQESEAAVSLAKASLDPSLSASTNLTSSESKTFLAGFPMDSSSTNWSTDLAVSGSSSAGTTWQVSTAVAQANSTTTSAALGGGVPQEQNNWTANLGVSVSQDLLAPVRQSASRIAIRQAAERRDQAELAMLTTRQTSFTQVAATWWTWKRAADRVALSQAQLASNRRLEVQTEARVAEGYVERMELDRVTGQRLQSERDLIQAGRTERKSADDLLVLMGENPGTDIDPVGEGSLGGVQSLDLALHMERAANGNLELVTARTGLDIAKNSRNDARDARMPTLAVVGSASLGSLDGTFANALSALGSDSAFPTYAAGLEFAVPLGGMAARAQRRAADATVLRQELSIEDTERKVEAQVRAAVHAVETSLQDVSLAQARVQVARRTEEAEQARVDEGTRRKDDLLDAVSARETAEFDLLDARLSVSAAELELVRLEGALVFPEVAGSVR